VKIFFSIFFVKMASTTSSKDWREKLAPGTLVYCTDLISIVSFTAEVVEPGVVDDDLSVGGKHF
jgi:hypothetical protein